MLDRVDIENTLRQFYGTSQWYQHWAKYFTYTDGVKFVAESCEAHWLVDAIASYQCEKRVNREPFQVWELIVSNGFATLTMKSDSGKPDIVYQEIEYTNFPLEKMEMWLENQVLYLPTER